MIITIMASERNTLPEIVILYYDLTRMNVYWEYFLTQLKLSTPLSKLQHYTAYMDYQVNTELGWVVYDSINSYLYLLVITLV